jgi:hypothetical protein
MSEDFTGDDGFSSSQGSTKTILFAISILNAECPNHVIFANRSTSSLNLLNRSAVRLNENKRDADEQFRR